jgi:hypothetical protein
MAFSQEWHALGREAELAAEQIASGVTALGRASHAQKGYYTQAFFGLSIGLERLAKLIIICDYAIENSGRFPSNDELKKCRHDIASLVDICETLSTKHRTGKKHADRPNEPVHRGIIETLTEFGKLSRYYNLDLITQGKATRLPEPIEAWWSRVGQLILSKHYSKRQQERDAAKYRAMAMVMRSSTSVLHHSEEGIMIDDIETLMLHAGATNVVQRYGRLYTLQIVRWLAFLISDLSRIGADERRIEPLLWLNEPFAMFGGEDGYLRDRKIWSIYRL